MISYRARYDPSQVDELRDTMLANLRAIIGNKIVLLYGQAAGSELLRQFFIDSGASRVLDLPLPGRHATCLSHLFQIQNEGLLHPDRDMTRYLDRIDPTKEAKVYAGSAVSAETLDGRKVIGSRLSEWRQFERKQHQCEVTRGQDQYDPHYIDFLNGCHMDDLLEYCVQGRPCIVSGDVRGGIAMGADYVYMIHQDTPLRMLKRICNRLYQACDGVRVASFDEGMPATYYGFVSGDQYILYGPAEALVGVRWRDNKVVAPGILVPVVVPDVLLAKARADVLVVVKRLVDWIGYRGAFGVDGCIRGDGFVVHEINTRICAGFSLLSRFYRSQIPLGIVDAIIRESNSERCRSLLVILGHDADTLCRATDLRLWGDDELERDLRERMPQSADATGMANWRTLVRTTALSSSTPFYTYYSERQIGHRDWS